ncbi:hypothetical protein P4T70_23815 [Bacillus mobilis]|uniref:hypothetical protein n=1 Tax=Bacillus mobilis TaxID=2026190 RepID=UPI002E1C9372|nr:hypothetical protein [Bacillus mobilis]
MNILSFIADVIAERCMGWKEVERPFSEENWNPIRVYVDKEGREIMEVRKFNPLRKEGQVFMILDELKKQHMKFSFGVNEKQTAYNFKMFDKEKNIMHEVEHVEMMAVICLGVLVWAGITITPEIAGAVDIEVIS